MSSENERKKWDSKEYLAKHKVHSLFEQLVAELVVHKPNDPIDYLSTRVRIA